MSGRRGALIALGIGALGWGAIYALNLHVIEVVAAAPGLLAGLLAGSLTRGGAPFVGLIAGYGGAWAGYVGWTYATFGGLGEFAFLIFPLVIVAAVGFAVGRVVRLLASVLVRRLGPRLLDR